MFLYVQFVKMFLIFFSALFNTPLAFLPTNDNRVKDHVWHNNIRNRKANSSRRLWSNPNGVNQRMQNPCQTRNANQVDGNPRLRIGKDVHKEEEQHRDDILQIITVRPTNPLDGWIIKCDGFQVVQSGVFEVSVCLYKKCCYNNIVFLFRRLFYICWNSLVCG